MVRGQIFLVEYLYILLEIPSLQGTLKKSWLPKQALGRMEQIIPHYKPSYLSFSVKVCIYW
jgi:hypothetical protein